MKNIVPYLLIIILLSTSCSSVRVANKNNGKAIKETHYTKAKEFLQDHNMEKALSEIDLALKDKSTTQQGELLYLKGLVLHSQNKYDAAISSYESILNLENTTSKRKEKAGQLIKLVKQSIVYERIQDSLNVMETEKANGEEVSKIPLPIYDKVPIFQGCPVTNNEEINSCMSQKIAQHVVKTYDTTIGNTFNTNDYVRTFVTYEIDRNGTVSNIRAKGSDPILAIEAMRVIIALPQMTAGTINKEPVSVLYTIPITFKME